MKSFRNPKYLERYEDVVYDLEQALDTAQQITLTKLKQALDLLLIIQEKLLLLIGITPDYQWILK